MSPEDDLAAAFEEGLRSQVLRLPRCEDCARFHWYPMSRCPHCQARRIRWQAVDPQGSVFTITTVRHAFDDDVSQSIPYTVALVELPAAPGVRLLAEIVGSDRLSIGDRVWPVFLNGTGRSRLLYSGRQQDGVEPR